MPGSFGKGRESDTLRSVLTSRALRAAGIELCFAEMKDPVKDKLKRFGLFTRLGEHTFFATVEEAVGAYRAAHPAVRSD